MEFGLYLISISTFLPYGVMLLIGIVIAIIFWSRQPKVAFCAVWGLGLHLLAWAISAGLSLWTMHVGLNLSEYGHLDIGYVGSIFSWASAGISVVGWAFIIYAMFFLKPGSKSLPDIQGCSERTE